MIESIKDGEKHVRAREESEHQETRNAKAKGKSLEKRLGEKGNLNSNEREEIGNQHGAAA